MASGVACVARTFPYFDVWIARTLRRRFDSRSFAEFAFVSGRHWLLAASAQRLQTGRVFQSSRDGAITRRRFSHSTRDLPSPDNSRQADVLAVDIQGRDSAAGESGRSRVRSLPKSWTYSLERPRRLGEASPAVWPAVYFELGKGKLSALVTLTAAAGYFFHNHLVLRKVFNSR